MKIWCRCGLNSNTNGYQMHSRAPMTNMAGHVTTIILGGNADFMATKVI